MHSMLSVMMQAMHPIQPIRSRISNNIISMWHLPLWYFVDLDVLQNATGDPDPEIGEIKHLVRAGEEAKVTRLRFTTTFGH